MTAPVPEVGRGFPAWWLRIAIGLVGAAVLVIPSFESTVGGAVVLLAPMILASMWAPASPVPAAVVIGGAVLVAVAGDDPLRPVVLAMIPTVYLFHVLCGLAGVLPANGRLHWAALRRPALRFLLVQAVVFALAGLAALLPTGRVPAVVEIGALTGLAALAAVILVLQRREPASPGDHSHTHGAGRPEG